MVCRCIKLRLADMQPHSSPLSLLVQIVNVHIIRDIAHLDVNGFHLKMRFQNLGTIAHQFQQCQRIFATRDTHQYPVAILNECIVGACLVKSLLDA